MKEMALSAADRAELNRLGIENIKIKLSYAGPGPGPVWLPGGPAKMAAMNKCLAQSHKSRTGQRD